MSLYDLVVSQCCCARQPHADDLWPAFPPPIRRSIAKARRTGDQDVEWTPPPALKESASTAALRASSAKGSSSDRTRRLFGITSSAPAPVSAPCCDMPVEGVTSSSVPAAAVLRGSRDRQVRTPLAEMARNLSATLREPSPAKHGEPPDANRLPPQRLSQFLNV